MAGRPAEIPKDIFCSTILAHKNSVLVENKVVVKSDSIWDDISKIFQNKITANSIHSMVCGNRYGVLKSLGKKSDPKEDNLRKGNSESSADEENILPKKSGFYNRKKIEFEVEIPKECFDEMTMEVEYLRSTREAKSKRRKYLKFKSGMWQPYFNRVLWDHFQMECGLNYGGHNLNLGGLSGVFDGNYLIFSLFSNDDTFRFIARFHKNLKSVIFYLSRNRLATIFMEKKNILLIFILT